jgi:hypothetical protein
MFRHRQQLRRWAAGTLLVWLFGIATGVAQACLAPSPIERGGQQSDPATAVGAEHAKAAAPASGIHQASHPVQHEGVVGHDGSLDKSNCQDFCEKSAIAIPPLKSALDKVQGHALPPVAVATLCPLPAAEPAQLSVPRRDGGLAPPIRLAFLRLTL